MAENIAILKSRAETLDTITTRTSVRRYTDSPVTKQQLDTVLHAGFCAPSAHNYRPWEYLVLQTRENLDALAEAGRYAKMMFKAPCAVVVCGDTQKQPNYQLLNQDCSAVIQNMLLAAHALGLGAVWCGVTEGADWQKVMIDRFSLPANIQPLGVVVLGRPDEVREVKPRFEPEKIHYDIW